jgi:hypothetical protein
MQVGILLVNVARAQIEDNYVTVARKPKRLDFERLIQDKAYRAKLRKLLISNAIIGEKADAGTGGMAEVKFGNFYVHFNTDESLVRDWQNIVSENPPKAGQIRRDCDLLTHLEGLANRILLNKGGISGSVRARNWYESIRQQNPAVASQGVVVGGRIATDVRILNNTIQGVLEGVHLGMSHRKSPKGTPDLAGRLQIKGNTIGLILPPIAFRERYGIFIGNCNSNIIGNNYIRVKRFLKTVNVHIEGIRIFGHSGRMMIVKQNHLENFTVGIYVNPLNQIRQELFQWAVTDNMAPKARMVVEIGERPKPGESEAEKQARQQRNAEKRKKIRRENNYS